MNEYQPEDNTTIKIFINFWKYNCSKSVTADYPDIRELLTICLAEVTAEYMMSKITFLIRPNGQPHSNVYL